MSRCIEPEDRARSAPRAPLPEWYNRTDDDSDEPKHFESAKAADQDPDEAQLDSITCDQRSHDLVAAQKDETAQADARSAGVVAPVIASCNVNAATAR